MPLSKEEFKYFQRQIILDEIKLEGLEQIQSKSVLIIGSGGLGCPLLLMCSGLGFKNIGIVDFDTVSIHNLHRQYLYNYNEINLSKSELAAKKITKRNPFINVNTHNVLLDESNVESIIQEYNIIADGTDNFSTRYLVNDTCVKLNKPLVSGSIFKFICQVGLFNLQGSKNLRDIFPEPPLPEEAPSCAEAGVANTVTTYCASLMAQLILMIALNKAEYFKNKLLLSNLLTLEQKIIQY
jgi:adenylyltransferase/sulfurtransferase